MSKMNETTLYMLIGTGFIFILVLITMLYCVYKGKKNENQREKYKYLCIDRVLELSLAFTILYGVVYLDSSVFFMLMLLAIADYPIQTKLGSLRQQVEDNKENKPVEGEMD